MRPNFYKAEIWYIRQCPIYNSAPKWPDTTYCVLYHLKFLEFWI